MTRIITILAVFTLAPSLFAQSNVDPDDKWSWSENCGWMNWRDAGEPAGALGVALESTHMRGFVWGENIGWINVGNGGGPYLNTTGANFGVNVDAEGLLWGYAWGENIGWINFEGGALASPSNPARIEEGRLRGYAWGENIGWINLDDANAFVAFTPSCPGDVTGDGLVNLADLNLVLANFGTMTNSGDATGDGQVNLADLNLVLANFGADCE
jgi:hypothetical protein